MDNKNFYISALVALISYFFIIFLVYIYLTVNSVKKFDSHSQDTILELDVVLEDMNLKKTKQLKRQTSRKDSQISKKIVKKSSSVTAKQRSDLKSLFAKVETKSKVIRKETINNVKGSQTVSRFKSKFEKQKKNDNSILSKLLDGQKIDSIKQNTSDSQNEYDEYISQIYEILHKRWQPLLIIDGLSTKVIITIYSNGKFDYSIVQYSGDSSFDNQLILFLNKQKMESFPKPKNNRIDIEVIFTAKG
jgi:hypothetical protein